MDAEEEQLEWLRTAERLLDECRLRLKRLKVDEVETHWPSMAQVYSNLNVNLSSIRAMQQQVWEELDKFRERIYDDTSN